MLKDQSQHLLAIYVDQLLLHCELNSLELQVINVYSNFYIILLSTWQICQNFTQVQQAGDGLSNDLSLIFEIIKLNTYVKTKNKHLIFLFTELGLYSDRSEHPATKTEVTLLIIQIADSPLYSNIFIQSILSSDQLMCYTFEVLPSKYVVMIFIHILNIYVHR